MSKKFKIGDHVQWNSEAGRVTGVIIKKIMSDTKFKGYTHHASREAPQYLIKSDKTDHVAIHKGPLTRSEYFSNARKLGLKRSALQGPLRYKRIFAWVLKNPRRLKTPVRYRHPYGSIIWVNLRPGVQAAISRQRSST